MASLLKMVLQKRHILSFPPAFSGKNGPKIYAFSNENADLLWSTVDR